MKRAKIITGDVFDVLPTLESESVQTVITSPPYWNLRDYGVEGQFGLEETPEEYIEKMVVIFREVRRVLRKDGTLWLNVGDKYNGSGKGGDKPGNEGKQSTNRGALSVRDRETNISTLKPKDLYMMPARVAMALQADGWWLRSDIIWAKPNPMPSSVTDRPTASHEYLFLLSKSAKYYYDYFAIMENNVTFHDGNKFGGKKHSGQSGRRYSGRVYKRKPGRNKRSVWMISYQPTSLPHYAAYPEKLVEPCILAGTSEVGACPECGKAWERIIEKTGGTTGKSWHDHGDDLGGGQSQGSHPGGIGAKQAREGNPYRVKTIGWKCDCNCGTSREDAVPCVVMDPFCGSGTTGLVALKHRRHFIGIELNPEYVQMAEKRMAPYLNQRELAL